LQVAGRSLKDSEHIVTKFADLAADFVPEEPLRYFQLRPLVKIDSSFDLLILGFRV
jgi:uncharacterized membrane protein